MCVRARMTHLLHSSVHPAPQNIRAGNAGGVVARGESSSSWSDDRCVAQQRVRDARGRCPLHSLALGRRNAPLSGRMGACRCACRCGFALPIVLCKRGTAWPDQPPCCCRGGGGTAAGCQPHPLAGVCTRCSLAVKDRLRNTAPTHGRPTLTAYVVPSANQQRRAYTTHAAGASFFCRSGFCNLQVVVPPSPLCSNLFGTSAVGTFQDTGHGHASTRRLPRFS